MTLRDWSVQWLDVYKNPFLTKSALDTIGYCLNHILPEFGDREIGDINGAELQRFLLTLSSTPNMQDKCRKLLLSLFSFAYLNRVIDWDPMAAVKMKPYRYDNTPCMDENMRHQFVESLNGYKYQDLYLTYLYTGARRAELVAPGGIDVDFKNHYVHIHGTKTESSDRIIPLFDKLQTLLVGLHDYHSYFESYKPDWVSLCFKRHMQKYFPGTNYSVRSLRCTFSLMCYELGVRESTIQSWLGHTTPRTTETYYLNKREIALSRLAAVQHEIDIVNKSL